MANNGIYRRLEALEGRVRPRQPERSTDARERMREHLDRLVILRRGELGSEEAAEVEATHAAIERRLTQIRGEGVTVESSMYRF
jgi:hypothetical protein